MQSLTWFQVNAWRLAQHGLSARLARADFVEAVTRTGGIQAQLMSAAELALWARTDGLSPLDVQAALWQARTLVKTWAMRGTLHLISAAELPLYVAARRHHDNRNWLGYFDYYGFTPAQYGAFLAAIPEILGSEPMTREELAAALAEHTGLPQLRGLIVESSWGSPLKPSAFRGDLCFGPSRGQNVTFINPAKWLGQWETIEPQAALQEVLRRYLLAYGPSTPVDFTLWWWGGAGLTHAKKLFQSLRDELEPVEVEGWQGTALRETVAPMRGLAASDSVQLLPLFDAYTLGIGRDIEALLPLALKRRVYRPQGWISAVVLSGGILKGVWTYKLRKGQAAVKIELFSAPTSALKRGIEAEAARLGVFLNAPVVVEISAG